MTIHRTGCSLATLLGAALAIAAPLAGSREPAPDGAASKLARGKYLVTIAGCNDCHTPLKLGPDGPGPDMSRMLSGHPESLQMPPVPKLPEGPWGAVARQHVHRVVRTLGRELHGEPDARSRDGARSLDAAEFQGHLPHRTAHGSRPADPAADADTDVQELHR